MAEHGDKKPQKIVKTYKEFGKIKRPRKLSSEQKQEIIRRLFEKDPELFSTDPELKEKIRNRLDWVDGANPIKPKLKELKNFAEEVRDSFANVVWCGMGGSSLFPLVLKRVIGEKEGYPQFFVLDSNDPEEIEKIEKLDLKNTLFVIASKSGTTVETLSHFKYFWKKISDLKSNPGENFVALTDPDSPLEALAKEKNFRKVFHHPPKIGGRYAALSEIGFLPAALMGLDLEKAISYADKMKEACAPNIPWEYNLGTTLSEFLIESYIQGLDKLTFIVDPLLKPFILWLEQLVSESLGKELTGIVPVVSESPGSPTVYGNDRVFVYLALSGRESLYMALVKELKEVGFNVKQIILEDRYEIFGECYRWMIAIALCGYFLSVNPFDEPDVILAKKNTKEVLKRFKETKDFGIEFYLDEDTSLAYYFEKTLTLEYPRLGALIKKFFSDLSPWSYIGFLAYLPEKEEIEEVFREMRSLVREKKGCATVFGFGPRYLHSSGQLYKGGPILSRFIIFTRKGRKEDQIIPEEGYTFWDQQFAQAFGDFKALIEKNKPVMWIHLGKNYMEDLIKFKEKFAKNLTIF